MPTLRVLAIDKPPELNVIVGQSHFIKTVEDLHEVFVGTAASLRFGNAFCEASGARLVRRTGNDAELVELATRNALAIGAGHSLAETALGRGIVGVIDGEPPVGVETDDDVVDRKRLLRDIGYKL